jgi:transcriptional regulator with XRE-family HTH domain
MDYARIAAEFLRVLRGKRSQGALCRRLDFRSNVVHQWERGRSFPTAARALWVASRLGVNVREAFREFYRVEPPWLSEVEPASRQGVAAFLRDLRGSTKVVDLARYSGRSRFVIARWLSGDTEPRLHDFFALVECCSLRLLDLLEQFVDVKALPSVRDAYGKLQVARRLAYDEPWSQAVLRALELRRYAELSAHRDGWIAAQIGVPRSVETRCLRRLAESGQIEWRNERWHVSNVMAVDLRRDPQAARRLRAWWLRQGAEQAEAGKRGVMYNVFGLSGADLGRVRELQKDYLTELRAIVARSEPVEHVVLAADLLLELGPLGGAAPRLA